MFLILRKGTFSCQDHEITPSLTTLFRRPRKVPNEELANESRSTHITVATDMVFSLSHYLNGVSLVQFLI